MMSHNLVFKDYIGEIVTAGVQFHGQPGRSYLTTGLLVSVEKGILTIKTKKGFRMIPTDSIIEFRIEVA